MSRNRLSKSVRILNPLGGAGYTSRKKAIEYISQGRAVLVGSDAIRFQETDYRHAAARASREPRAPYDAIQGLPVCGFDAVQRLTANRKTPKRTPWQAKAAAKIRSFQTRHKPVST